MHPLTSLSEEEGMFKAEIAKFATSSILPLRTQMDENEQLDPHLVAASFDLGLMGIEIPEKWGGAGGSFFMSCLAIEELAKVDPSLAVFVDVQNTLVNNIFLNWGSAEQQAKYLPRLAQQQVGSFCLTEADSGSDAFALQSRALPQGNGWRLSGKKTFITNASEAGIFVVFASVDPALGYKGITAFIVEKTMKGFSLGKKEKKLGIRASSTCEVILEGVEVGPEHVLGEVGKGYKVAIETLNEGRIGIAAQMLGLAQGAFAGAFTYAGQRSQFGRQINQFQGVQFQLAEMACEIEAAKLLMYNAARLKDAGQVFTKEAAMAKFTCSAVAEKVASQALEVYGGYGFIKEYPAEKFYRDAKIGKLYEGTSNLQLQTIFKVLEKQFG